MPFGSTPVICIPSEYSRFIERENLPFTVMLGAYIGAEVSNPNCPWGGVYSDETLQKNRINNQQELDRAVAWANRYERNCRRRIRGQRGDRRLD